MKTKTAEIALRPFERSDFKRLISWVPTTQAHGKWCGSFFGYPLDEIRLQRYLDSAREPNTRAIFTAVLPSGEPVGHVEISQMTSAKFEPPTENAAINLVNFAATISEFGLNSVNIDMSEHLT